MSEKTRIEWSFSPPNYFEDPFSDKFQGVQITIDDGHIVAELDAIDYDRDPSIRGRLREHLEALFVGVQLQSHRVFDIQEGSLYRDRPDGKTDTTLFLKPVGATIKVSTKADIQITDAQGNVTGDTKQERIRQKKEFAILVASKLGTDSVLDSMLKSYSRSLEDPANELVHLYEIRDALAKKCGGERSARQAIGISERKWKTLGKLANYEPLIQGRHRGKHPSQLRDATEQELETARSIAREMIVGYMRFLS